MPDTIPPDLHTYASLVGRHFRDRPDAERRAIEDDLARHLHELGHADIEACRRELGPPEDYAVELRTSLGLPPPAPPAGIRPRTLVGVAGLALVLLVPVVVWYLTRPFSPPPNFTALQNEGGATWNESGTTVGTALRISVDQGGLAGMATRYTNTSGQALAVQGIRVDPIGIDDRGSVIAPLDNGFFEIRSDDDYLTTDEIWATTASMADPADVEVLESEGGDWWRELEPFVWQPSQSIFLRIGGPVIACDSEAIRFTPTMTSGAGRKIMLEYRIDGREYREEIGSYRIDFEACVTDGP